jgi:hypothetical protein
VQPVNSPEGEAGRELGVVLKGVLKVVPVAPVLVVVLKGVPVALIHPKVETIKVKILQLKKCRLYIIY